MRILVVVGARPQFVKASPLSRVLRAAGDEEILVHTGQHYDPELSGRFFEELDLRRPDVCLDVGSAPRAEQMSAMRAGVEAVVAGRAPDWVVVFGDTNSTLAGALAAEAARTPLAHIEAGVRSGNLRMQEEVNRIETDRLSSLLLCPCGRAAENLAAEHVQARTEVVGDVMLDALEAVRPYLSEDVPRAHGLEPGRYLLVTAHRAETADDAERLGGVLTALRDLGEPAVFPTHPRTRRSLSRFALTVPDNVRLTDPVGYLECLSLQAFARAVLTDSGGIEKEAYWLGVPCVTMRDETEWMETVEAGWNVLAGTDHKRITKAARSLAPPAERPHLYGEPGAAERCVCLLEEAGGSRSSPESPVEAAT